MHKFIFLCRSIIILFEMCVQIKHEICKRFVSLNISVKIEMNVKKCSNCIYIDIIFCFVHRAGLTGLRLSVAHTMCVIAIELSVKDLYFSIFRWLLIGSCVLSQARDKRQNIFLYYWCVFYVVYLCTLSDMM